MGGEKKGKTGTWMVALFVILVLLGVWYFFLRGSEDSVGPIASGDYQAVFVDNGQVYFGKLDQSDDEFYLLTDVFYLQSSVAVTETAALSLTKLGAEAHGPEDSMKINVEHILFIEDMKNDSKVVQAIQSYKSK